MRYFARLAQRVVHWPTTQTQAGKLYDVDVRLRPDGGNCRGVWMRSPSTSASAPDLGDAALVRACPIAGDAATMERFAAVRAQLLARPRDANSCRAGDRHACAGVPN